MEIVAIGRKIAKIKATRREEVNTDPRRDRPPQRSLEKQKGKPHSGKENCSSHGATRANEEIQPMSQKMPRANTPRPQGVNRGTKSPKPNQ